MVALHDCGPVLYLDVWRFPANDHGLLSATTYFKHCQSCEDGCDEHHNVVHDP